jgi:lipopolysaccharide transport system permease protein
MTAHTPLTARAPTAAPAPAGPPPAPPKPITVVDSRARFAPSALLQWWQYRELAYALTVREVKARYRQTLLGFGWAVAQPLAFMVVFSLVFSRFARLPSDGIPYPIFAYAALVPWTFLSNALNTATIGLVSQRSVVTKTYFPREVIILSQVGARFVDFLAAALILAGMILYYALRGEVTPSAWILFAPVLLLVEIVLIVGLSLVTSALHVSFRDLAPIVTLGLQVWLYLTPVSYPLSVVPDWLWPFYVLNPMVGIIDGFRSTIARGQPPAWDLFAISTAISVILLVGALIYFKRAERAFADVI